MTDKIRMNENITALLKSDKGTIKITGKGETTWLKRLSRKLLNFTLSK